MTLFSTHYVSAYYCRQYPFHIYRNLVDMGSHNDVSLGSLLARSYLRLTGCSLIPDRMTDAQAATWLYELAPFAVLAHNTLPDPLFVYGNKAAQRLFEYDWDELITLPSR
jgi:hypothetical protein